MLQAQYPLSVVWALFSCVKFCLVTQFIFKLSIFTIILLKYTLLLICCPENDVIGHRVNEDRSLTDIVSHLIHLPFRVNNAYELHFVRESSLLPLLIAMVSCCPVWVPIHLSDLSSLCKVRLQIVLNQTLPRQFLSWIVWEVTAACHSW